MSQGPDERLVEDISIHIFSVSAGMVGVCLTVIGIVRLVIATRNAGTLADDLLAADSLLFMTSCFLAYAALRSPNKNRTRRLENTADAIFLLALFVMVGACALITYAVL